MRRTWLTCVLGLALLPACNLAAPEELLRNLLGLVQPPARDDTLPLRYWLYRQRLTERFMRTGSTAAGYSLPATRIRPSGLHWSDATVHLGWYMGVLATEHYLIRSGRLIALPGLPNAGVTEPFSALANVERELYFALVALDRLDRTGEAAFATPTNCSGAAFDVPGFFIRDDVPIDFLVNGAQTYYSDYSAPFQKHLIPGVIEDYLVDVYVIYNKEMSQDQIYHLLIGLALTKRYMQGVVVENAPLALYAELLAERLVQRMSADGWRLNNPACFKNVQRGEDARIFSYGTALALARITDGRVRIDRDAQASAWYGLAPHGAVGGIGGALVENTSYPDNLHMIMAIAAVGRGWDRSTLAHLNLLAGTYDWDIYPLLYQALHGDAPDWPLHEPWLRARVLPVLNSAPWTGPASFVSVSGWRSDHRFLRPTSAQEQTPEDTPTEYNGLDFMLLHNLSIIAKL
jgi:hypothetical protein